MGWDGGVVAVCVNACITSVGAPSHCTDAALQHSLVVVCKCVDRYRPVGAHALRPRGMTEGEGNSPHALLPVPATRGLGMPNDQRQHSPDCPCSEIFGRWFTSQVVEY